MLQVAAACPDIQRMIFKFNPQFLSSYTQVLRTVLLCTALWPPAGRVLPAVQAGDLGRRVLLQRAGRLAGGSNHTVTVTWRDVMVAVEVIGPRLEGLHLCHVEELGLASLTHLAQQCPALNSLTLENCRWGTLTVQTTVQRP